MGRKLPVKTIVSILQTWDNIYHLHRDKHLDYFCLGFRSQPEIEIIEWYFSSTPSYEQYEEISQLYEFFKSSEDWDKLPASTITKIQQRFVNIWFRMMQDAMDKRDSDTVSKMKNSPIMEIEQVIL